MNGVTAVVMPDVGCGMWDAQFKKKEDTMNEIEIGSTL